eukprot:122927-Hanusia_phi.AAC.6
MDSSSMYVGPIPKPRAPKSSHYRGVSKTVRGPDKIGLQCNLMMSVFVGKWQARLCVNSTQRNLGCSFKTPEDAARVWDAAAILHFGTGINPQMLNFPDEYKPNHQEYYQNFLVSSGALTSGIRWQSARELGEKEGMSRDATLEAVSSHPMNGDDVYAQPYTGAGGALIDPGFVPMGEDDYDGSGMLGWNEFQRAFRGQGVPMSNLQQMYRSYKRGAESSIVENYPDVDLRRAEEEAAHTRTMMANGLSQFLDTLDEYGLKDDM